MLPARARLRRSSDFAAAVRRGPTSMRAGRPTLVLHAQLPTNPPDPSEPFPARAGLVVSRAVGPAVVRNRVKRRLRHLLRERLDRLPAGAVLVVRANPAAATASGQQLSQDLDSALAVLSRRQKGRSA